MVREGKQFYPESKSNLLFLFNSTVDSMARMSILFKLKVATNLFD